MVGVLEGLRVVEISAPGPSRFCGMLLADLGADVITIERPDPDGEAGQARPEQILNRGKRSITLDLKKPEAADIVLRLVERADALIENMRPGKMEQLGLGPDVCLTHRPSLVYGRMTGWGQNGPLAEAAGHQSNFAALSGELWLSSAPGQQPDAVPAELGDICGAALYLTVGVLAAVLRARADGRGQVVDAAMVDSSAHMLNRLLSAVPGLGGDFQRAKAREARHWARSYRCSDDEWVYIDAEEPQFYTDLVERLGLGHDQRFVTGQSTPEIWPVLSDELARLFATKTRAEWCGLLEGTNACFAPVLAPLDSANHPHMTTRGVYTTVDGVLQTAPAPRFSTTPSARSAPVPVRGAHTHDLLSELQLSQNQMDQLVKSGALGATS